MRRTAAACCCIAGFLLLFNLIYTHFAFGRSSPYMRWMSLIPLAGGALPALILLYSGCAGRVSRPALNLWNAGLATLTAGCLVRGIVNMSGRYTDYDLVYWVFGTAMLAAAAITAVAAETWNAGRKHKSSKNSVF